MAASGFDRKAKATGSAKGARPARPFGRGLGRVSAPGLHAGPAAGEETTPAPARVGWQEAIATTVGGLGYELVDVERAPRGLLRITIDRLPGRVYRVGHGAEARADTSEFVTVEDCEAVTRQLQYVLEVEGLDYARLEVSSPGLDRPLKREADYNRFVGQAVRIALKQPFEGRKVWEGVLAAVDGGGWSLSIKNGKTELVLGFTLAEVRDARLVPVVNFKGRQAGAAPTGGEDKAAAPAPAAPASDGGW